MDRIPKFFRDPLGAVTRRKSTSSTNSVRATTKQASTAKDDASQKDKLKEYGQVAHSAFEQRETPPRHPYSHLPTIIDRGVPYPQSARKDHLYWNSVLLEGPRSHDVDSADKNPSPGSHRDVEHRTRRWNINADKGKGKATQSEYLTASKNTTSNSSPRKRQVQHQPSHEEVNNPGSITCLTTPTPRKNLDMLSELNPNKTTLSSSLDPSPLPPSPSAAPNNIGASTDSISFCPSTVLPTTETLLIYGSPGHRRRVLFPTQPPSPPLPSMDSPSPTSERSNSPSSSHATVTTLHPHTWNKALNTILNSGKVDADTVDAVRDRARSSVSMNGTRGHEAVNMLDVGLVPNFSFPMDGACWYDAQCHDEETEVTGAKDPEPENYRQDGDDSSEESDAMYMRERRRGRTWSDKGSAYRQPSVHTISSTCSTVSLQDGDFDDDAMPFANDNALFNGTSCGTPWPSLCGDASSSQDNSFFRSPYGPRCNDNNATHRPTSPYLRKHDSGIGASTSTILIRRPSFQAQQPQPPSLDTSGPEWQDPAAKIRHLEAIIDAMQEGMAKLSAENNALWNLVDSFKRMLRVVWKRDASLAQGLEDAMARELEPGAEQVKSGKNGARVLKRSRTLQPNELPNWSVPKQNQSTRRSWLAGLARRASFTSVKSIFSTRSRSEGGSVLDLPAYEDVAHKAQNMADQSRAFVPLEVDASPVPTLAQEVDALVSFAQLHMRRLEEDVDDFGELEGACRDLRCARLVDLED